MNCQISLAERIKALQAEIEYDQARVETDEDRRFLRAKLDELEKLIAQAEAEAASKAAKPKEVNMPKRKKESAQRAIPLKAPAEPVRTAEVSAPDPAPPSMASRVRKAMRKPHLRWYRRERYKTILHESTGRWTGKSITWPDYLALRKKGRVQLRKKE